jgi:hypothetical protein
MSFNTYVKHGGTPLVAGPEGPPIVFVSHRSTDKPLARALVRVFEELHLHYWLDENDADLQRAAQLGMTGDAALVHAIERGLRHATWLMGLFTPRTFGSWWVPYEIGFARAQGKQASFVAQGLRILESIIPEYATICSVYSSVDEIARWAATLAGHDLHSNIATVNSCVLKELTQFLPALPEPPSVQLACAAALDAIELLGRPDVQNELALSSSSFSWMPAVGDAIKRLGYALLAPLSIRQLRLPVSHRERETLDLCAAALTQHDALAASPPAIEYSPAAGDWKVCRYQTPAKSWLQGLRPEQLSERIARFLLTRTHAAHLRLATEAEFSAEYDRVKRSYGADQRSLGVLLNPLFGFNPFDRPIYWRVLAAQALAYSNLLGKALPSCFEATTRRVAERFVSTRHSGSVCGAQRSACDQGDL